MLNMMMQMMQVMMQMMNVMMGQKPQAQTATALPAGQAQPSQTGGAGTGLLAGLGGTAGTGIAGTSATAGSSATAGTGLLSSLGGTAGTAGTSATAGSSVTAANCPPNGSSQTGGASISNATGSYGTAPASSVSGAYGTTPVSSTTGGASTGATTGTGSSIQAPPHNAAPLTHDDFVNYVLAGSKGGTSGTDEGIFSNFATPGSKFSQAGDNEFDAVIAKSYASQFKAYAMGLPAAFIPGQTSVDQVATNIEKGQAAQFTPEAELLSQVAATYRGDFGGASKYDNGKLKDLLNSWGRSDIVNADPLVGKTDVQSIGGVVKALNEQPDAGTRQQWLQQIFDFQGNTPVSPSGAVPNAPEYQRAIAMVQSGTLDNLVNNYNNGIKTSGPVQIPGDPTAGGSQTGGASTGGVTTDPATGLPTGPTSTPDVDRNINFHNQDFATRSAEGLSDQDRAIDHLWGRQIVSKGIQDGSVYLNVLNDTTNSAYKPAERQLVQQLVGQEIGITDPAQISQIDSQTLLNNKDKITGKALDQSFFGLMQRLNPDQQIDTSRWLNAQAHAWDGQPINQIDDLNALQQQTGLSGFDQGVLRLWGHDPLLNGGKVDGSILAYTIGNPNALDNQGVGANGVKGDGSTSVDGIAQSLLESDFASDGVRNGDSLKFAFGRVLDKVYLGAADPTAESVGANAQAVAQTNGRTPQQIGQDVQQGVTKALADAANMVKDHPLISAAAVGGIAAAAAVCPFLAGMGAGAAGIAAGSAMMNKNASSAGGTQAA